jgi:hypothetical protein
MGATLEEVAGRADVSLEDAGELLKFPIYGRQTVRAIKQRRLVREALDAGYPVDESFAAGVEAARRAHRDAQRAGMDPENRPAYVSEMVNQALGGEAVSGQLLVGHREEELRKPGSRPHKGVTDWWADRSSSGMAGAGQQGSLSRKVPEVMAFNDGVLHAVRKAGGPDVRVPNVHTLLPWDEFYGPVLARGGCHKADVRYLRAKYLDLTEPVPTAVVYTPDTELRATSVEQFVELLNKLVKRAGLQGRKLAERAGLSTSQMYSMIDIKRAVLPTSGEQVSSLVRACGLGKDQVGWVMRLWGELRNRGPESAYDRPQLDLLWALARATPVTSSGNCDPLAMVRRVMAVLACDVTASADDQGWAVGQLIAATPAEQRTEMLKLVDKISDGTRAVGELEGGAGSAA